MGKTIISALWPGDTYCTWRSLGDIERGERSMEEEMHFVATSCRQERPVDREGIRATCRRSAEVDGELQWTDSETWASKYCREVRILNPLSDPLKAPFQPFTALLLRMRQTL